MSARERSTYIYYSIVPYSKLDNVSDWLTLPLFYGLIKEWCFYHASLNKEFIWMRILGDQAKLLLNLTLDLSLHDGNIIFCSDEWVLEGWK